MVDKLKKGNRVKILVGAWMLSSPDSPIVKAMNLEPIGKTDKGLIAYDRMAHLIGVEATISGLSGNSYALDIDGHGYMAWFERWQLELIS